MSSVQFTPKLGDIRHNLERLAGFVGKAASADSKLAVLPEICDIGYDLETIKQLAQTFPNDSSHAISEMAKRHNLIIIAGLAEKRSDGLYNTPLNEPKYFNAGSKIPVFEVEGLKIGVAICFDIRFPEIFRKLALEAAEIIALPTAFPLSRVEHLETCTRARSIENQNFMISANICGRISKTEFGGRSMIVSAGGDILAKASDSKEEIITATIDLEDIEKFRKEKPVLSKLRPEIY